MNIIANGTEVLIFKYVREWELNQDDENYIPLNYRSFKKDNFLGILDIIKIDEQNVDEEGI